MLEFRKIRNGFELYYKNHLLIRHTKSHPCVQIGAGKGKFQAKNGEFKIKEKLKERIELKAFRLLEKTNSQIKFEFKSEKKILILTVKINGKQLEITPHCEKSNINRFWLSFKADKDEAIYGCGEQFSELNLNGKKVPLWVQEKGIGRGEPQISGDWFTTYFPQPTFISTSHYYCHVQTTAYSELNFSHEGYHEIYVWEIPNKVVIGKFKTLIEVVSNLSEYIGRQPKLPPWIFDGVILGIQGGEEIVLEKLGKALDKDMNVCALWCQDWQGIRFTDFGKQLFWDWKYDESLYPNLPSLIEKLEKGDIRFLGYINCFLAMDGDLYKEASEKGYMIRNKEGNVYEVETFNADCSIVDLTNPEACDWLKSIIKINMIDIGLGGWMADYGEYTPVDAVFHSGKDGKLIHNEYPVLWAQINYEVLKESNKLEETFYFTRSGFSGISNYTMSMFSGDQLVNWSKMDGIATVMPAFLSLGFCGVGYTHFDIGGYTTLGEFVRNKEVFMRWAELAAFTMFMRTHEGNRPSENWQFDSDEETLEHLARMSRIHVLLKPYLLHLSKEYQKKGIPPMRACIMHYENDYNLREMKHQYMLGQDMLIAPVIEPKKEKWEVYLPDDDWVHVWSDKEYKKGNYIIEAPIGDPPVFYRKTSDFKKIFETLKKI
ncbi:MAG: alpha-glucosidase [Promethearchaeota archaeon]|nr:MAG: alpha-glucosidase [Candidatus Lokiarchaeota archaeon]